MDVAERSLLDLTEKSLAVLREARAREDALRADLTEARRWKQMYEEAAAAKQRLEHDLCAAEQRASALRAQVATRSEAGMPRRYPSNLRSARTEASQVRMRIRKLDSENSRLDGFMSARGGLFPLPISRTASTGVLDPIQQQPYNTADEPQSPSKASDDTPNQSSMHSTAQHSASGYTEPPMRVNRAPTLDLSGLLSMFVTANLLHQDSYTAAAATAQRQHEPQQQHGDAGSNGGAGSELNAQAPFSQISPQGQVAPGPGGTPLSEHTLNDPSVPIHGQISAPAGPDLPLDVPSDNTSSLASSGKLRSWSASGPEAEPLVRPPATNRHTLDGKGGYQEGLAAPADAPSHTSMSSVSLVDDDGTSGVGLAAAAAVAAAAARAWAAAASQQRQQTQQHRNTSASSLQHAPGSLTGSDLSVHEMAMAASNSGGLSSHLNQQHGSSGSRKPGKVGYKLVASVYREPPALITKASLAPHTPSHAASTANITSLAPPSPPPLHHAHSLTDHLDQHAHHNFSSAPFNTSPLDGPRGSSGSGQAGASQPGGGSMGGPHSLASAGRDAGSQDLARRAAYALEAVQQAVALSRNSNIDEGASSVAADVSVKAEAQGTLSENGIAQAAGSLGSDAVSMSVLNQASRGASSEQQAGPTTDTQVPAAMLRHASERRGGWYGCGGIDSSGDLSELDSLRKQAVQRQPPTLSAAAAAGAAAARQQGEGSATAPGSNNTAAMRSADSAGMQQQQLQAPGGSTPAATRGTGNASSEDPLQAEAANSSTAEPEPPQRLPSTGVWTGGTTTTTTTRAGQPAGSSETVETSNGSPMVVLARDGTATPDSAPATAAVMAGSSAGALATASKVPLPPLLPPAAEAAGRLQGSFRVLEPTTCPGGHLADNTAAVGHAVPALVAGTVSRRSPSTISVLQRQSFSDSKPAVSRLSLDSQVAAGAQRPVRRGAADQQQHQHADTQLGRPATDAPGGQQQADEQQPLGPTHPLLAQAKQHWDAHIHSAIPDPHALSTAPGHPAPSSTPPSTPAPATPSGGNAVCSACDKDATKSTALTLHWLSPPRTALVVCKLSSAVYPLLNAVLRWLRARSLSVYVEPETYQQVDPQIRDPDSASGDSGGSLCPAEGVACGAVTGGSGSGGGVLTWAAGRCPNQSIPDEVAQDLDFVVVLGGDGTLLWTCHVFGNRAVPPLVPFNMGSLGFLTPFPPTLLDDMLALVLAGGFPMILRHRLHATIVRVPQEEGRPAQGDVCWADGHCATEKVVLNEVVVDRGISPFLTNLECFCDGNFVTHVQGDGLIISTPTGSTAYSLAAGGSMVHPQVPGILFTPVCPHSLSFRPLVFPDHVQLCIQVPQGARSQMYCSFDGKDRQELNAGDAIIIRMSQWPIPTVCSRDPSRDWFTGIREGLHWNVRSVQGHAG